MKRTIMVIGITALCAAATFGQTQATANRVRTSGSAEQLKQIENEWVAAVKAKDAAKLEDILADDWVSLTWDGRTIDRATALAELKEPGNSLENIEMGPMKVRLFGSTAVVTGSDTEKSMEKGKDTSGKYVWTDVFVKENGKWRAVASQSAKVPE
jgi:ketosteroid isomerase-like protein